MGEGLAGGGTAPSCMAERLVAALIAYHVWCHVLMTALREGRNRHSQRWYRLFNEAPALLLDLLLTNCFTRTYIKQKWTLLKVSEFLSDPIWIRTRDLQK